MRAWLEHEEARPVAGFRPASASGVAIGPGSRRRSLCRFVPAVAACVAALRARDRLGGIQTGRRAWISLRARVLDINVLMLVAVAGAMALGEWSEGASVVFLFAFAQLLETRAMERARGAIRALMDLAPAEALVRRGAVTGASGRRRRVAI